MTIYLYRNFAVFRKGRSMTKSYLNGLNIRILGLVYFGQSLNMIFKKKRYDTFLWEILKIRQGTGFYCCIFCFYRLKLLGLGLVFVILGCSRWFCNPPSFWGSAMLYLMSPKADCCSISDDLSCFLIILTALTKISSFSIIVYSYIVLTFIPFISSHIALTFNTKNVILPVLAISCQPFYSYR